MISRSEHSDLPIDVALATVPAAVAIAEESTEAKHSREDDQGVFDVAQHPEQTTTEAFEDEWAPSAKRSTKKEKRKSKKSVFEDGTRDVNVHAPLIVDDQADFRQETVDQSTAEQASESVGRE